MPTNGDYATKTDLKELRDHLVNAIRQSESNLRNEMTELIRDTETKLLKAFYGFAEATQKRMDNLENSQGGLTGIIATLDRRVTDLEKKVNFPKAP